jgi:TonB family protein
MLGSALVLLLAVHPAAAAAPDLSSARALYASAAYEEALSVLNAIETPENTELIDQYRALCLLALGRVDQAKASLERIVLRKPLYAMPEAEVSPRLVTLFHEVRRQALPEAATGVYEAARTSFDRGQFETAAAQFRELLAIAGDPDVDRQQSSLAELSRLAEGFLKLSEAALAPPPAPPAAAPAPAPGPPPVPELYTVGAEGVTAPVAIERTLPPWSPPSPALARSIFRGVLEVVINEQGIVERASLTEPISPLYDRRLLEAAKGWRFRPATKDGTPVSFQLPISIVLQPSQ